MDDKLFNQQWIRAYILSPRIHLNFSSPALDDEWAMWNNGGEL